MVTQILFAVNEGRENIWVICDDTDMFLLLLHFYSMLNLSCKRMMAGTSKDRVLIDIGQKPLYNLRYCTSLSAPALSDCDTTAWMNGIGKGNAMHALLKGVKLPSMGDPNAVWETYYMKLPIL